MGLWLSAHRRRGTGDRLIGTRQNLLGEEGLSPLVLRASEWAHFSFSLRGVLTAVSTYSDAVTVSEVFKTPLYSFGHWLEPRKVLA